LTQRFEQIRYPRLKPWVSDGKLLWQIPFAPERRAYNAATPIIDGQTVIYTRAGRGTFAVEIVKDGDGCAVKEKWSNAEAGVQFNTPVLKDGFLYGLTNQGNFFCINSQTGETAWLDPTQTDRSGFTALVDAGPVILALPSNGELIVIQPNTKEFTVLARIEVFETGTYAHPVVAGNRIFIKDDNTLALWTLE
jgi:outer membrane protein assembly factor BamB